MGFKQYDSGLSASGFTHNLVINDVNTTIYYMISRYTVFNTAILTKEFQTYTQTDQTGDFYHMQVHLLAQDHPQLLEAIISV